MDANSAFLADALVGIGEFNLEPRDIVTIFSRGEQLYPYRHSLANMVFSAHSVIGLPPDAWGGFPGDYAKYHGIPRNLRTDRPGLTHVRNRLSGTRDNLSILKFAAKDKCINQQLKSTESPGRNPLDELLEQINEASGNTLPFLYYNVTIALSHLTHIRKTPALAS